MLVLWSTSCAAEIIEMFDLLSVEINLSIPWARMTAISTNQHYSLAWRQLALRKLSCNTECRATCKDSGGGGETMATHMRHNPLIQNQGWRHIFSTKSASFREFLAPFPGDAPANTALGQKPKRDRRQSEGLNVKTEPLFDG